MMASRLLRSARRRAGKTQRELASASGVPQATVARIESGEVDPRLGTLRKLLHACGYDLELARLLGEGVDRHHIRANLALTPAQRLDRVAREAAALASLRGIASRQRSASTATPVANGAESDGAEGRQHTVRDSVS
jgi:transcriptional regulator with XRE-family HTH domain